MCVSACDCTTDNCFWPFVQPRIISERDRLLLFYWQRPIFPLFAIDSADASAGRLRVHVDYRKSGTDGRRVGSSQKDCAPTDDHIGRIWYMYARRTDGRRKKVDVCRAQSAVATAQSCAGDRGDETSDFVSVAALDGRTDEITFPTSVRPSIPVAFESIAAAPPRPVLRRRCCCSFPPLGYSIIEPILRCTLLPTVKEPIPSLVVGAISQSGSPYRAVMAACVCGSVFFLRRIKRYISFARQLIPGIPVWR